MNTIYAVNYVKYAWKFSYGGSNGETDLLQIHWGRILGHNYEAKRIFLIFDSNFEIMNYETLYYVHVLLV